MDCGLDCEQDCEQDCGSDCGPDCGSDCVAGRPWQAAWFAPRRSSACSRWWPAADLSDDWRPISACSRPTAPPTRVLSKLIDRELVLAEVIATRRPSRPPRRWTARCSACASGSRRQPRSRPRWALGDRREAPARNAAAGSADARALDQRFSTADRRVTLIDEWMAGLRRRGGVIDLFRRTVKAGRSKQRQHACLVPFPPRGPTHSPIEAEERHDLQQVEARVADDRRDARPAPQNTTPQNAPSSPVAMPASIP